MIAARASAAVDVPVVVSHDHHPVSQSDTVVVEEPLELRLRCMQETRRIALTMRTPGNDIELAAGFVLNEGIVATAEDIVAIRHCDDRLATPEERGNIVTVETRAVIPAGLLLERHFTITSACGVCGTAAIERLSARGLTPLESGARIASTVLASLPERMRPHQRLFSATGGLHAAALFALDGTLLALREDIGRHNAVDKIAGWLALQRRADPARTALAVSGRCSYEIVQKALCAGIPIVAAVSAPSSLAVSFAQRFGITLACFVREDRWSAYAAPERIV